ncbi:bifunctional RNase H/acid phosphatase [Mycobacterium sp. 852002-51961_SCH5331710]|uniref:bifunctional RNase H/acid phosphatase n=1 Tax=Mycobacterium sp. 852002-51961_SCH5331710 TaxID=1834105 RepID=UPI0007FEA453|nr:bifunctional RNase H/acid phosphatase [Mycobacterium sp. 852002-51961_SCH5331710]OBB38823.1 bifunctional RNase H/acid phosphatase [Mycobacterium sp. 852002-51961_SCH5331710]
MKVIVEADGGSRGNPGPAGYGSVVWSADHGAVLAESKEAIGRATNNVAEYRGLIAGLSEAASLGATEVDVLMDSKLVVEQMSGRWKVKHPDIAPLHQQATALAARFDRVTYQWIPRAENSHADRLANEAMDAAAEMPTSGEESKPHQASNPTAWSGARGAPTRLLLLRHGQTELSVDRRYSGRGNPALTDLGRRQAEAAAQYLGQRGGVAAVVTSPLQRAYDTAAAAAKVLGLDVTVDDDLIETDFGAWEGLTFTEAAERDPDLHRRWLRDTSLAPPEGESFDSAAERVGRARARIVTEHAGETVLVVSHVTPIKTLLRMALDGGPNILYRLHLDLASLSIAEFYPDGAASVRLVNQTAYLD